MHTAYLRDLAAERSLRSAHHDLARAGPSAWTNHRPDLAITHTVRLSGFSIVSCRAGSSQVVTFGRGEDGQLGHGDPEDQQTPLVVEELRGAHIGAVACGAEYTVAVSRNGSEVYSWGWCGSCRAAGSCSYAAPGRLLDGHSSVSAQLRAYARKTFSRTRRSRCACTHACGAGTLR